MRWRDGVIDVFLQPGEFYFASHDTRIHTLLGSCVAVTLWNAKRRIGGMCHFLLPTRWQNDNAALNGRYGDEALQLLVREMVRAGSRPQEYEARIFGAGAMFPSPPRKHDCLGPDAEVPCSIASAMCAGVVSSSTPQCTDIPCKNQVAARFLMEQYAFTVRAQDLGGTAHRNIVFDIGTGDVWSRQPGECAKGVTFTEVT